MIGADILTWLGRFVIALLIIGVGALYGRGWANRQKEARPPHRWQSATFVLGLSLAGFTLVSEFVTLAATYYSAREVQHILITGMVPLLLLISDPFVTIMAGLPDHQQQRIDKKWQSPTVQKWAHRLTAPGLVWSAFVVTFWLWHDQNLIAASRDSAWVHLLEISSLVTIGCLYWWQIAEVRPRLHRPMKGLLRLGYVFAGMIPIKLLGLFLLFGSETIAGGNVTYNTAELLQFGHIIIADRSLAAVILWFIGGFTYTYSAIFLAGRQMGVEEAKPTRARSILEEDETWRAPAIRR